MEYVWGALAGLAWGALCGWLNILIMKKAVEKNTSNAVTGAAAARMAVDLAALTLVFLLRNVLPFSYEAMLVGAAVALSIVTLVFAFRYGKK